MAKAGNVLDLSPLGVRVEFQEERDGTTKLSLLVSARLDGIDEGEVRSVVLGSLGGRGYGQAQMAELWRGADTLEVTRGDPHVTAANKVLPLHRAG